MRVKATDMDVILVKRLLKINPGRGINRSDNPKVYEKETYYKEYRSLNNARPIFLRFEDQGIMLQLISRFLGSSDLGPKNTRTIPSKILEAMSYIQLNLDQKLTVAALATRSNQNQDYFSRQFLAHTGQRPMNYIHEKKVERAQYLSRPPTKPLWKLPWIPVLPICRTSPNNQLPRGKPKRYSKEETLSHIDAERRGIKPI